MKTISENTHNSKNSLRILLLTGFVLIIPTIYFLMFPSYLSTMPRPLKHRYHQKVKDRKETISTKTKNITNQWDKTYKPENVPDDVELEIISKQYPNIPLKFWKTVEMKRSQMFLTNSSCAPFPDIFKLDIHNTYWQKIHMSNMTTVQVYSAYYDKRDISGKMVRILSMANRTNINFPGNRTLHCQFWFEGEDQPVIAPMDNLEYMWIEYWHSHGEGTYGPYLLGCSIPESHQEKIPQVVSFVENPCDIATNMLRVVYEEPDVKREFTVCVKGLDFLQVDLSLRLVEWIEIVLLMGVDKIYLYQLEVHPNVQKVLDYYSKLGKIDVRDITLPSGHPNVPFLQHMFLLDNNINQCLDEIIPYNDCFYRNLYSHEYVGIFDIDEIILPLKDDNWHGLVKRTIGYDAANLIYNGFTARHIYFLDEMEKDGPYAEVPTYMHMMQHVHRSQNFTNPGDFVKTLFSTNYTISCHNHWPISTAPDTITKEFNLEDARMQHYRKHCSWEVNCTLFSMDPVKDTRLWDFKDILVPRVNSALEEIGFIKVV